MLAAGRLRGGWPRTAGCGCRAGPAAGLRRAFAADKNRWASDQQRDFLGGGGAGRGSSFDEFFGARGQAAAPISGAFASVHDRYELGPELGSGQFRTVYDATDRETGAHSPGRCIHSETTL